MNQMSEETAGSERRIVTCDDCGTPYAAVVEGEELLLVGSDGVECPTCGGTAFSRLTL